jgi:chaperonin cofactor prefoldin
MHTSIEELKKIDEALEPLDRQREAALRRMLKIDADISEADDDDVIEDLKEQRERARIHILTILSQMEPLFRQAGFDC